MRRRNCGALVRDRFGWYGALERDGTFCGFSGVGGWSVTWDVLVLWNGMLLRRGRERQVGRRDGDIGRATDGEG